MAMVLQQATTAIDPRVDKLRKSIEEVIKKKNEDVLCKVGAILAGGILDAGGRNTIISLASKSGFSKLGACISMMTFTHFWYWFPLVHFINLTLAPSAIIGVNSNFKIPKSFEFRSNARPSLFDYPPKVKPNEGKVQSKAEKFNLSVTAKVKARAERKKQGEGDDDNIASKPIRTFSSKVGGSSFIDDKDKKKEETKMEVEKEDEKKKEEPDYQILNNPARVLERQRKHIQYINNRYSPIIPERNNGIIFLKDSQPDQSDEYIELGAKPPVNNKPQQ